MAKRESSAPRTYRLAAGAVRDEAGLSLIITMLVMVLVSAIGVAMTSVASTEMAISANGRHAVEAFYAADSGLEQIKVDLRGDSTWVGQIINVSTLQVRTPFPDSFTINGNSVMIRLRPASS